MRWRTLLVVARYVAAALMLVISVLACGYLALVATISVGDSYPEPIDTQGWARLVGFSSSLIAEGALWSGIGLMVTAAFTLVGARLRRSRWMWAGIVCCALFALTLLVVTVSGPARLDRLIERANAAIENGPAVSPPYAGPPVPPLFTAQDTRSAIRKMADASQIAAVGPVTDTDGVAVSLAETVPKSAACNDSGSEVSVNLDFHTGDNAQSLDRILAAWDKAGYAPDRAMQEDIRYSATLPIASMTIRDSTTIDGLIHLYIVGQCAIP